MHFIAVSFRAKSLVFCPWFFYLNKYSFVFLRQTKSITDNQPAIDEVIWQISKSRGRWQRLWWWRPDSWSECIERRGWTGKSFILFDNCSILNVGRWKQTLDNSHSYFVVFEVSFLLFTNITIVVFLRFKCNDSPMYFRLKYKKVLGNISKMEDIKSWFSNFNCYFNLGTINDI